jgi:hypothetical protein
MLPSDMVDRLMNGQPGLVESELFLVMLDPCETPEVDDEDGPLFPPLARNPRDEKLRDWRRLGRARVKSRARTV